jgi:hypothetical protein
MAEGDVSYPNPNGSKVRLEQTWATSFGDRNANYDCYL